MAQLPTFIIKIQKNQPNVGRYTIHGSSMDPMGYRMIEQELDYFCLEKGDKLRLIFRTCENPFQRNLA